MAIITLEACGGDLGVEDFSKLLKQVKSSHSTFLFSQTANMSKTRNSGLIIHRTSRTSFVFPESDAPHPPDTQQNSENTKIISSLWAPATVSQREGRRQRGGQTRDGGDGVGRYSSCARVVEREKRIWD
jgi:hypothetical protein